jgi:signal transduction histidine kinase/CheY-like chemotaxis protein/HAMP domain-containing protein
VARGDLSQKITVDARGEILELKSTVNTMVDQLSSFADEVTRVAREVGTEGRLGGQAAVPHVSGTWRDLTDNVNSMASNLTGQVRNIAQVTTAVARGDLSQKITVDARGEILELKDTVNTMVDQLSSFADEVTRVAREVGTEGRLGGQAQVRDVAGTWRDLTESVNQLASTLTTQLRAIAEVSTAVTRGDLTQRIGVRAQGEVAQLKDTLNLMIATLLDTTNANAEQGWLDSNLARIGGLLQGQHDLSDVAAMILQEVVPLAGAQIGAFFLAEFGEGEADSAHPLGWRLAAGLGVSGPLLDLDAPVVFGPREGLVGQVGTTKKTVVVRDVAPDLLTIRSGLGEITPVEVILLPVTFEGEVHGVIELGSLMPFSDLHRVFLERLVGAIGVTVRTIRASRRTEVLLSEAQRLTLELREQSAELQRTNAELEEKAELLSDRNRKIEIKNLEIDAARRGVEEKAQQLALASQYKSDFLANMSHELRNPLNSLLLLSRMLADNPDRNLTAKQIEFASTIHDAGSDLLDLINDILDLSKIEAGRVDVYPAPVDLLGVPDYLDAVFRAQAEQKGLELDLRVRPGTTSIVTDVQRLRQILRNLLANAVKFTGSGSVELVVEPAEPGSGYEEAGLVGAQDVVRFVVRDTGIGIAPEKLGMIFEAFQQADGTTSRRFGGTGLGLSISRELARLLGGVITVSSQVGVGSTFTLYLPAVVPDATAAPEPSGETTEPDTDAAAAPRVPIIRPAAPEPAGSAGVRLRDVTVLIVDDDVRNVFALTSALERHGMTVLYADNGADGLRLLAEHPEVRVVLMDAMMPELDGYETTRRMRAGPAGADVPILFLTAKAMPEDRRASLASGASDYITKPVDLEALLTTMASWVRGDGDPGADERAAR